MTEDTDPFDLGQRNPLPAEQPDVTARTGLLVVVIFNTAFWGGLALVVALIH